MQTTTSITLTSTTPDQRVELNSGTSTPMELDVTVLAHVAGGQGPNGNWAQTSTTAGPNSGW